LRSLRDDFALLEGTLAELVEAGVRSGSRGCAVAALRRLEARAQVSGSEWAMGIAACARTVIGDDERAEGSYLEAIERLGSTRARVPLGRVRLLYGEWLRRRGRRVDARQQLTPAHGVFSEVGLGGFAERARRELLATRPHGPEAHDDTHASTSSHSTRRSRRSRPAAARILRSDSGYSSAPAPSNGTSARSSPTSA
jgi:hypothetical protein